MGAKPAAPAVTGEEVVGAVPLPEAEGLVAMVVGQSVVAGMDSLWPPVWVGAAVVGAAVVGASDWEAGAELPPLPASAQSFWVAGRTLSVGEHVVSCVCSYHQVLSRGLPCGSKLGLSDKLTQGHVGTALGDDARGGITLDLGEVVGLADARVVGGGARGDLLDGGVKARNSARRQVGSALGRDQGGHGDNGGSSELHFDGIKRVCWFEVEVGECTKTTSELEY